jgi:competence protein ComGC
MKGMRSSFYQRHGFMVIELFIVIGIIAILIGLLLPAVQKVREAASRSTIREDLKEIVSVVNAWKKEHGTLPSSATLCELLPEYCDGSVHPQITDGTSNTILFTERPPLMKDGYFFGISRVEASAERDVDGSDFLIWSRAVLPGRTGMLNYEASSNGKIQAFVHPSSVEEQRKMFAELRARGERAVRELVMKATSGLRGPIRVPSPVSSAQAFAKLNADGDDLLTVEEIVGYPVLDQGQTLGEILNLKEIMGFGAGGEDFLGLGVATFELPAVQRPALPAVQTPERP